MLFLVGEATTGNTFLIALGLFCTDWPMYVAVTLPNGESNLLGPSGPMHQTKWQKSRRESGLPKWQFLA
jgi:hypothetical protein